MPFDLDPGSSSGFGAVAGWIGTGLAGLVVAAVTVRKFILSWRSDGLEGASLEARHEIITRLHEELSRLSQQNAILAEQINKLQIQIIDLRTETGSLTNENQALRGQIEALRSEIASLRESNSGDSRPAPFK
jgi:FtsZ-binding cell division protein ZapB